MVIHQGDIFWVDLPIPVASEPGFRRPLVVIQNNVFNYSRISTVMVCGLTSNLRLAAAPGNILLEPGEAHLPKQSVVNVSQIFTVDRSQLGDIIGTLSPRRVRQILDGIQLVIEPREPQGDQQTRKQ
jgi:mRNA interferase MazF